MIALNGYLTAVGKNRGYSFINVIVFGFYGRLIQVLERAAFLSKNL